MMKLSSSSLLVPFTFAHLSEQVDDDGLDFQVLNGSFSQTQPRTIKYWGSLSNPSLEEPDDSSRGGIVVGSQDGTVWLFAPHQRQTPGGSPIPPSQPSTPSHPSRQSQAPSRTSSSSITSPLPFNVTPRPRVVSGINTEQVEAPKNYVDFEDEPEKLKEMLKGRYPREGKEMQSASDDATDRAPSRELSPTPSALAVPTVKRKTVPRSLLSAAQSSGFRSPSPSSASFPVGSISPETPYTFDLWCHIIPSRSGPRGAVTSICLLDEDNLIAVLQEMGDVSIFSSQDGTCLATMQEGETVLRPPTGMTDRVSSHALWSWNCLEKYHIGESTILLASAAIDPNYPSLGPLDSEDNSEKARLALFELHITEHFAPYDVTLLKIGQWSYDGVPQAVGLHQDSDQVTTFFAVTAVGRFVIRGVHFSPRVPEQTEEQSQNAPAPATHLSSLPRANPFKATKSRSAEKIPLGDSRKEHGKVALDGERDLGEILPGGLPSGFRAHNMTGKMLAVVWSQQELTVFEYRLGVLRILYIQTLQGIQDVPWLDNSSYAVLSRDRAERFAVSAMEQINSNGDTVNSTTSTPVRPQLLQTIALDQYDAADIGFGSQILTTSTFEYGGPKLTCYEDAEISRTLWQANHKRRDPVKNPQVTSLLPLESDIVIGGYGDGCLRRLSLMQMLRKPDKLRPPRDEPPIPLNGSVTGLHVVQNARTKERFVVGGADDGSVAFWSIHDLKLCARWTVFITPVRSIITVQDTQDEPLAGCVLCVSEDGTIAVIVIDDFQFLYIIPGSAAPLCRICISGHNLLLIYADRRARLWDVQTREFWRSMSLEKANELLDSGGWTDLSLDGYACLPDIVLKRIPGLLGPDTASTLVLDLERFTAESTEISKAISTNRNQTRTILLTLDRLRCILSGLLTPGLNSDIDAICFEKLGVSLPRVSIGLVSCGAVTLYQGNNVRDPWCRSAEASAARALSITVILNALSLFEECMEGANNVMVFYATSLADRVGPRYKPPSLVYLARRWFDGSIEVSRAARTLFDYTIACLSDEDSLGIVEHWQHYLPCLQPTAERESTRAALALFLCGYLAAEKYSLIQTSTLTDISKSIALHLHDEKSTYRVLAVDLCSKGFHVWQHYIDAIEILRSLFTLATTSRKDSINLENIGLQARLAVLQIASSHTGLFMTTLGLDILNPPSLEHRKSVLQIVAYLIRKRPLVLQPNIPKLMEAVVKSIDPTNTTHREAVLDTATEIIGYVVKTFPSVDFHMTTQRLAVGTSEGAVIMYDVKTAVRLYVLEGHQKTISACSFSPDGRRLVTLSLEESVVLVWKVGSSFVSFFYPGAPPRQGHGGSEPFKTLNFNVGSDGNMGVQGVMEWVRFEWLGDRSVKLRVRESIMTFST